MPGRRGQDVRKQARKSAGKPENQLTEVGGHEMVIKDVDSLLSKRVVRRAGTLGK